MGALPLWLLLLWTMLTFDLAMATSIYSLVGIAGIALVVITGIGIWAYRRGGLLVSALALFLLSLPFSVTISRFGLGPQEVLLYTIWLVGALYSPLGIRQWLIQVFSSISPVARFAILLFALAVGQSAIHPGVTDLVTATTNLRQEVVFPVLLSFLVAYAVRTRRCIPTLLQAFIAGAILFACYALALRVLDVGIGTGSVAGRLGAEQSIVEGYHPNTLGLYLVFGLAFAVPLILRSLRSAALSEVKLAAVCGGMTLALIALWLTYSRGALVALVAVAAVLLAGGVLLANWRVRLVYLGAAGIAIVGVALVAISGASFLGRYLPLLSPSALLADPSVQFRFDLYQRAWSLIQAHPFTGVGLGGFSQGSAVPFSPHDTYLEVLVSAGFFGLGGLLLVMGVGIVAAARTFTRWRAHGSSQNAWYILGIVGALAGFLVQAVTESFAGHPSIFPAAWFLVACALGSEGRWRIVSARAAPEMSEELPALSNAASASHEATAGRGSPRDPGGLPADPGSRPSSDGRRDALDGVARNPALANAEASWAFDTGPVPAFGAIEDDPLDSSAHLAAIWPWRVGSQRAAARYGHVSGTGGPLLQSDEARQRATGAPRSEGGQTGPRITGAPPVDTTEARQRAVSQELLRRAPASYVWNQAYTLWFFAMNFLLSVVIARQLTQQEYGIYSILLTVITTVLFVFALGMEDVATVFVPRLLGLGGERMAGTLARRLLLSRITVLFGVAVALALFVSLAPVLVGFGIPLDTSLLEGPYGPVVRGVLMAAYLMGTGVVALENALFASVLRSRVVLLVGGCSQGLIVALAAGVLALGGGVDGLFAVLAAATWLTALAYLIPLRRLLLSRSQRRLGQGREMRSLMVTAWLTNVTNGALGKQSDILLMGAFAVSFAAIGYYNLAYQLANILGVLLISGLGGVGPAAMSAAFSAGGRERLAGVWRSVVMLQLALTLPILVFGIVRADAIVSVLYSNRYAGAVPLLQLFLLATLIGRLVGGGVHQSALYVVGRQRLVLINRWVGLVVNIGLDLALIPRYGPYGALAATGTTQVLVGALEQLLVRRYLPVHYPTGFAGRVLGAGALASVSLVWWSPQNLIGLASSFAAFVAVLVLALFALGLGDSVDVQRIFELRPGLRARLRLGQGHTLGPQGGDRSAMRRTIA
jgi:O-antigen/teichoic acid export membrane protein/O-antigen ligase